MTSPTAPSTLLARALSQLPGIGARTALRLVVSLARWTPERREGFLADIASLRELGACPRCGFLTGKSACRSCKDGAGAARLAVVAHPQDAMALEAAGWDGVAFHCLGGLLSPGRGVEERDLLLHPLQKRVGHKTKEVLLAFGPGVEADLTADAIRRILPEGIPVTRLAAGLPVGADLAYSDILTIQRAIEGRSKLK